MIFLLPLFFSLVSVVAYMFVGESNRLKIAALLMILVSIVLQFFFAQHVHFLVPLFMQLFLCICFAIYWSAER